MSGRSASVGGTLAGGVQDVAALLPIIGTEQCEIHVGSALDGGYLYAAATPLSIFGSLGIVKAGLSVLITSISVSIPKITISFRNFTPIVEYSEQRKWLGARLFSDAGFRLTGSVAPLIGMDGQRLKAETRLLEILEEKHIDTPEKLAVGWKSRHWNTMLAISTFICASLSLTPYIALLLGPESWRPSGVHLPWLYPALRIVGSCFVTISSQFIIQSRVISIMKHRLLFMTIDRRLKTMGSMLESWAQEKNLQWDQNLPAEQCLWSFEKVLPFTPSSGSANALEDNTDINQNSTPQHIGNDTVLANDSAHVAVPMTDKATPDHVPLAPSSENPIFQEDELYVWKQKHFPSRTHDTASTVLVWMVLGLSLAATMAGYIGCFTLVSATSTRGNGPLVWVGLEVVLSVIRIVIWASNPRFDEDTEITLGLELSEHQPMVTTNEYNPHIDELDGEGSEPFHLIPEREFFEWITPFTGPLDQFQKTDNITLYFTLTTDFGNNNIDLSEDDDSHEGSDDEESYYHIWENREELEDMPKTYGYPSEMGHSLRLLMTIFDSHMQIGVTLMSSDSSFIFFDVTTKYNTMSRKMEAARNSQLRNAHHWRIQDDKLFDSLKDYYRYMEHSFKRRKSSTTIRATLPWKWDLSPHSGRLASGLTQANNLSPNIQLPALTEQDVLYLDRGYEHQLTIELTDKWSGWILQDMKNIRSNTRNDCHNALKESIRRRGKLELTELDAQLAWGWARRELVLFRLSLELEDILRLRMDSCVSAVNRAIRDIHLVIWMRSEFESGRRKRLDQQRGGAKERLEEAMKDASEEADREGRSWEIYPKIFRPRWTQVIQFVDSQWRAGIENRWAGWKDTEDKLEGMITKSLEQQDRDEEYGSRWKVRFLKVFRLRVSHRHWLPQHKMEEQMMESTVERIRAVPQDVKAMAVAYRYPHPDSEATERFAVLDRSSSQGKACSATVYDAHFCERNVVCDIIAKSTTRSVVNVDPEIVPLIPPNDHLLFLSSRDGQEPAFVQRNRDRWWDQQTVNSSMFYFTSHPQGDSGTVARILVFLTTPSSVRVGVVHRSELSLWENGTELETIFPEELSGSTFQKFRSIVLQKGRHELELTTFSGSHGEERFWDIVVKLSDDISETRVDSDDNETDSDAD